VGTHDLAINREYSIYSSEHDDGLEFLVRIIEGGAVSSALGKLNPGDSVEIGGPYGSFCLSPEARRDNDFVFIASGTGIAPFSSFARSFPELNYRLVHGIRYEVEEYECEIFKPGTYFPCVSRPNLGQAPTRVTDWLTNNELDSAALYYLCGNRAMIVDAVQVLRSKGVPGGNVFMETFF
jgi:ferredoxin-NADP reductase